MAQDTNAYSRSEDSSCEDKSEDESISNDSKSASSNSEDDSDTSDKSEVHVELNNNNQFSSLHLPRSQKGTNLSDSDDDDDDEEEERKRDIIKNETKKDIGKKAAQDPELYCIRRSDRRRTEVTRNHFDDNKSFDKRKKRKRTTRQATTRSKAKVSNKSKKTFSSSEEEDDSYSSDDNYKKSRKAGKISKHRITRRKPNAFKISYKEESDDVTDSEDLIEIDQNEEEEDKEQYETIEKVVKSRIGRVGATGSRTTVYNVEKEGDPNKGFIVGGDENGETQYLIKWKNWANVHNTWECEVGLREQKVNGIKKLENFMKKEEELERWRSYATAEDQEYYNCQQEMTEDLYQQYCLIEKIVLHIPKPGADQCDYLVKWEGLPYSECTQEDGSLIVKRFPKAVEEYEERRKSTCFPNKNSRALKYRPKFQALKTQPDYIGGKDKLELRDYQLAGLNWLLHSWCKNNGAILADEMGLGKTIQTISFLSTLMYSHQVYGPFLLVVPLSTLVTWKKEFETWAPKINVVVYIGDVNSRVLIREHEWYHGGSKQLKFNVILTTYEILLKDKAILGTVNWAVLGVDEAHRLKNDDSLLYKILINFDTNHRIFITGTPLQNSLKELWSLLHFIMPEKFDSWEDFERRHSSADKTGFRHLHQELEPYLLRRVKKDVEKSLPAKVEQILRVEMTKVQKQYYRWILTKNYKALTKGGKGNITSFVNLVMELKKCCNHSFLVRSPTDEDYTKNRFELLVKSSGKLILLDKLLLKLRNAGHRVLIFSQMVRMLDILAEYLQLRHFPYQRLDGTIKGDIRKQAMDHFNAEGSQDFCFLLSTRAGGLGVNLATADTVIIFDSDWNPQNDLQAMARAHRIGQKNQVSVYRLVTKKSVEEDIVERAKKKMVLDHLVIQRMDTTGRTVLNRAGMGSQAGSSATPFNKEELSAILKFGAEELFKESEDEDDIQVDIDDILRLAETRNFEELKNSATDELLSKFKVVSFDNLEDQELEQNTFRALPMKDWEDIIPESERKKIDEEERLQLIREQNLPPRSRKTVTEKKEAGSDAEYDARKSRRKQKDDDEEEDDESSDDDSLDGEKSGKKKVRGKEIVKGFNESEVRKFLKSMKKFGKTLERLEDIAGDAELQEKSESDLKNLAELILNKCDQVMKEYEEKLREVTTAEEKKAIGRPTFRLGSIIVNARSVLQSLSELEPLCDIMPVDEKERDTLQIKAHVKNAHFDCFWTVEDDCRLLRGVYECGFGNWDAIKMDSTFKLQDKILPDGDLKPQAKHLQTRTEYLLKIIKKINDSSGIKKKPVKNVGKSSKKVKSKEIIDENAGSEDNDDASNEASRDGLAKDKKLKKKKNTDKKSLGMKDHKKKKSHHHHHHHHHSNQTGQADGPLHFTTNQTVSVEEESGLEPEVFKQCKESMRVVKKYLQHLKSPDTSMGDDELLKRTRDCLIKIGDRITAILTEYKEPNKIKEWRGHLWQFVSMFTDNFDAPRLHKMYKHALKGRTSEQEKLNSESGNQSASTSHYPTNTASSSTSVRHHHHHQQQPSSSSTSSSTHRADKNRSMDGRKEDRRKRDEEAFGWGSKARDRPTRDQGSYQNSYSDHRQKSGSGYYRDDRWRSRYGEHEATQQQSQSNPGSGYAPSASQFTSSYQSSYQSSYDRPKGTGHHQRAMGRGYPHNRDYTSSSTDSPRYYPPRRPPYPPTDRRDHHGWSEASFSMAFDSSSAAAAAGSGTTSQGDQEGRDSKHFDRKRRHAGSTDRDPRGRVNEGRPPKDSRLTASPSNRYPPSSNPLPPPPLPGMHPPLLTMPPPALSMHLMAPPPINQYPMQPPA
ncbi:hypothetical protein HELRODRAFT_192382 [Helobdella robusta]|uniref:DNA helicase n=1 Tax=Helobdella robusta TaxID=6412 RepID=T1FTW0_HELRO|nr:hypothetical protein HELRODRAFT_192382 [Helobdella robusta]ESO01124.1 hypothetical protein HELRODRAFT_192382 [Helobdella robusta]